MKKETKQEIIKQIPENYIEWKNEMNVDTGSMMAQAEVDEFIEYLKKKINDL